jgi:hypothetical protein
LLAGSSDFGFQETTQFTVVDDVDSSTRDSSTNWVQLINEDFVNGFGSFNSGGSNIKYYAGVKDRVGVVRIQDGDGMDSSVHSNHIVVGTSTTFKVVFSYYAYSMESTDGFCLDYSTDDGTSWHSEKCWLKLNDFENGSWYDDTEVTCTPSALNETDGLRVRLRCKASSIYDDVLVDSVAVYGNPLDQRDKCSNSVH